jgi:hypothetical protein
MPGVVPDVRCMMLRAFRTHTEPKLPLPRNRTTLNFLLSSLPGCDAAPGLAGAAAACIAGASTPRLARLLC